MQEAKVALEKKEYYAAIDQLADKLEIQSKSVSPPLLKHVYRLLLTISVGRS